LWRALPDGSGVVKDIASRAQSSNPHSLLVVGKYLYFIANDGVHGEELWRTDGSEVGTVMVRDIVNVPYEPVSAAEMTEAGERLFFAGDTVSQGSELWSFDFGALSVSPVLDIAQVDTLLLTRPAGEYER
jgi:ELWxxDGT repeat protein